MIKRIMLGLAALTMAASVYAADQKADQLSGGRIGFVDAEYILQQFQGDIDNKLRTEFGKEQQEITKLQDSLRADVEKMRRDEATMTKEQRETMRKSVETRQAELQRRGGAFNEHLNARGAEEMKAVLDRIKTAVDSVAMQKSLDIVLQKRTAVYTRNQPDITEEVMKKLQPGKQLNHKDKDTKKG